MRVCYTQDKKKDSSSDGEYDHSKPDYVRLPDFLDRNRRWNTVFMTHKHLTSLKC